MSNTTSLTANIATQGAAPAACAGGPARSAVVSLALLMAASVALTASPVRAATPPSAPAAGLAQFTSSGHVLGFDSGGY